MNRNFGRQLMRAMAVIVIAACCLSYDARSVHAKDPSNFRFLIVDDASTMRRIFRTQLKELGYWDVHEAEDGAVALAKLRYEPFDFVIADSNMPNMDGIQLLKHIRADPSLKAIPVLIVTAEAKKENIAEATQAGASGFLSKPLTKVALGQALDKVFAKPK